MKQNILYPFNLENSNFKSQSMAVELAKSLDVDLHLLVIYQNSDFLYSEHLEYAKTKEESVQELFDDLRMRYSDIFLGNKKQFSNRNGTGIDISFQDYQERPLRKKLPDNYLWVFDYQDFISNIIPAGFHSDLKEYDRKVWIISKSRSGILTQTQQLINQFSGSPVKNNKDEQYWDALPLDVL